MKTFKQYVQMLTEAKAKDKFPINKGYAYEFVLAAALVARFTDRYVGGEPMPLTPKAVRKTMVMHQKGWIEWQVEYGDKKVDVVEFNSEGLPKSVHKKWNKWSKHPETDKMIKSAIEAVGGNQTLTKLSLDVITNHKADDIVIKCIGTTEQNNTKSDVNVYVNGREQRKVGISVKYGGTRSAGQFASRDTVQNLIDGFKLFGLTKVDVSGVPGKDSKKITGRYVRPAGADPRTWRKKDKDVIKDKKLMYKVIDKVFKGIVTEYTEKELKNPVLSKAIMMGLKVANVGREDDVEVIRGKSITYDKKTFEMFGKYISKAAGDGNAKFKAVKLNGTPTLRFFANDYYLFQLRFRFGCDSNDQKIVYKVRWRLVVENGPHLDTLAKMKWKDILLQFFK